MKFNQVFFSLNLYFLSLFTWANTPITETEQRSPIQEIQSKEKKRDIEPKQYQSQQEIYRKLLEYLSLSQSDTTLEIVKNLLPQLETYPLLPYAEYQFLKAHKEKLSFDQVQTFSQKYPDFPIKDLMQYWLQQQYLIQNWNGIIEKEAALPVDATSTCILLNAQQEQANFTKANTTNKKIEEKSTALEISLKTLWQTGTSLPTQCQKPFLNGYQRRIITDDLIKQRALLALERNNGSLIAQLADLTKNQELKNWLNQLNLLLKAPQQLINQNNLFYINELAETPENQRILLAIMPNFIKGLNESNIDPNFPFAQLDQWAKRFKLSSQQTNEWLSSLLSQLFDSENTMIKQWRDNILLELKNDTLLERRIRIALREKTNIEPWLNALSAQSKNKDEWRYWQAKLLAQQGKKSQAEQIWQQMQQNTRGFYPMLAAEELNIDYQPMMQTFSQPLEPTLQKYKNQLARIKELSILKDNLNQKREWLALLASADFYEKLSLAKYAEQQQWFDLQVEATIKAKAWDFITLRLPNAYQDWFEYFLKNKKIYRTFAMAIARQESAWQTNVTSPANARGLMQLLPSTAKLTASKDQLPYSKESQLFNPIDNIMLGTAHLNHLAEKYGNNRILIAAAYNAGANRVDRWLDRSNGNLTMAEFIATIPFYETRGYVQNVLAYDYYYQILQEKTPEKFTKEEKNRLY